MGNLAPCFYAPSLVVPVSCDCLAQCEEAGHAARIECLLESPIFQPASGLLVDLRNFTPPWSGNPKQLQRTWPELFIRYDPALAARLRLVGAASTAQCGGHGFNVSLLTQSEVSGIRAMMPRAPFPKDGCTCAPGYSPPECTPTNSPRSRCINSCSGNGVCTMGTCVCDHRWRGIDCSMPASSAAASAHPALATSAAAASSAATTASSSSPSVKVPILASSAPPRNAEARIGAASPRIYIYDLPAELSSWLALPRSGIDGHESEGTPWWQVTDPMYSADVRLLTRLLASPHRTSQPEHADYFYVPLMLSLGFVSHRFGIYLPSQPAARLINRTITYIRKAYPYWNRTNGSNHMLAFTGDDGSTWLRGRLPSLAHAIFLTHWGMQCNDGAKLLYKPHHCVTAQLGFRSHRSGQDIVLPPLHSPHELLPASSWVRSNPAAHSNGPPQRSLDATPHDATSRDATSRDATPPDLDEIGHALQLGA